MTAIMDTFSLILTIGVLALMIFLIACLIGYFFSNNCKRKIDAVRYETYLIGIGAVALISTFMVLVYQYIFELEVCELCWWQRIFMFPIEIVIFIALYHKQKNAHITAAIFALIGGAIALHHYYNHFQNLVLNKEVILPCGQIGLVPSCSEFSFTVFGFMTIPGMALAAFVSILVLAFFAHRVQK